MIRRAANASCHYREPCIHCFGKDRWKSLAPARQDEDRRLAISVAEGGAGQVSGHDYVMLEPKTPDLVADLPFLIALADHDQFALRLLEHICKGFNEVEDSFLLDQPADEEQSSSWSGTV